MLFFNCFCNFVYFALRKPKLLLFRTKHKSTLTIWHVGLCRISPHSLLIQRSHILLRFHCICPPGYFGTLCDLDVNECEVSPCLHEGICINTPGGFKCVCRPGYTGSCFPLRWHEDQYESLKSLSWWLLWLAAFESSLTQIRLSRGEKKDSQCVLLISLQDTVAAFE